MNRHTGKTSTNPPAGVKCAAAAAIVAAGLALAAPVSAAIPAAPPPSLGYACEPPAPAAPGNCAGWHTTPVTVHWIYDPTLVPLSGCTDQLLASDTTGTTVVCNLTSVVTRAVTIKIDQTPPSVTGAVPDRPPDHNGWYNHPVAFTFAGSDATSGLAGCDSVLYTGPDTSTGTASGTCHDQAGNAGTGAVALQYDATPPVITPIPQESPPGEVRLQWSASPDAVEYSVSRSPGTHGDTPTTVYTGPSASYEDKNVNEQETYTYTITAVDVAANSSAVVILAVPGGYQMVLGARESGPGTTPTKRGPSIVAPSLPRLRWRAVRHADYYNVQVFRNRRKILSAWPARPRLQLKASWRFRGKRFQLAPGRYHWYAWPGYGKRRAHHYGRLITHKSFTIKNLR